MPSTLFSPGDLIVVRVPRDRETGIPIYSTTSPHTQIDTLYSAPVLVLAAGYYHNRVIVLTPTGSTGTVDEWYFTNANKNPR